MEIITAVFFGYLELLISWWWIILAVIATINFTALVLRECDRKMSVIKSLLLSFVCLFDMVPVVRRMIPEKLRRDLSDHFLQFQSGEPVWMFTSMLLPISWIFGPIALLISFILCIYCYVICTAFGHDINQYGFINAVKLKMGVRPESLKNRP